jgi:hypothetical protein
MRPSARILELLTSVEKRLFDVARNTLLAQVKVEESPGFVLSCPNVEKNEKRF